MNSYDEAGIARGPNAEINDGVPGLKGGSVCPGLCVVLVALATFF